MAKEKKTVEAAEAPAPAAKSSNENAARNEALVNGASESRKKLAKKVAKISSFVQDRQPFVSVATKRIDKAGKPIMGRKYTGPAPGLDFTIMSGTKNDWKLNIFGGWKNGTNPKTKQKVSREIKPCSDEVVDELNAALSGKGLNQSQVIGLAEIIKEKLRGTGGGGGRRGPRAPQEFLDLED